MEETNELLKAGLAGFLAGFFCSIPVGPINIAIINEGARKGLRWAMMIGLGAMAMDLVYCAVAFTGFSRLFTSSWVRATMELLSFIFMLYLGVKYLLVQSLPATTKTVDAVEQKLHPHTAFWIGFVRVLGNPAVLLFWVTVCASFLSHEWVEDTLASKAACVGGSFFGGMLWFALLSYLVSKGHGKFSTKGLIRMSHISGIFLLVVSLFIGLRLVELLARQR